MLIDYLRSFKKIEIIKGNSIVARSVRTLPSSDRRKISIVIIVQICLGFVDLAGVAAIGMLGSLAVRGVKSQGAGDRVERALQFLHIQNYSFQSQVAFLGCTAATLLIGRTLLSVFFSKKTLYFLSRRGAAVSSKLISKILGQNLLGIQSQTTQQTLYAVTRGVDSITIGVIGITVNLVADISLLIIISIGLIIVDPFIAIFTAVIFTTIGIVLYKLLNLRARKLGIAESELTVANNEKVVQVLNSYRELMVRNRRYFYAKEIEKTKYQLAETLANIAFLPNISKYVIESAVVVSTLIVSAAQFAMQDASHAVATLSVFMASTTRMAPAIMRIQQGSIGLRQCLGAASPTLDLIKRLQDIEPNQPTHDTIDFAHLGFIPSVILEEVSFQYPNKFDLALNQINLVVNPGDFVAIVGSSGAGKTTLVDVLLGVLIPQEGVVKISGANPPDSISNWPGAMAYVPQDISIIAGSIKENVALGFPFETIREDQVLRALEIAQLSHFVEGLPNRLNEKVGERGTTLSGGQRQRLGIARAMYTNPKLLVLDEATSALDGETESYISESIKTLSKSVTVITIAHRLSTVKDADKVVYMKDGKIVFIGTFQEVRDNIPDFDVQAKLMGL